MLNKALFYILSLFLIVSLVSLPLYSAGGTGTGTDEVKKESKLDLIKKAGKIVLGTTTDYPPYEFRMLGDEKVVGLDIDIAEAIAAKLGVKLEVKIYNFNQLLDVLKNGEVDMVLAALSPTENRKKHVDFTVPYYKADQSLLIRKADKKTITGIDDLKGKKLGVQIASSQMELALKHIDGAQLVEEEDMTNLVAGLNKGTCDAVMLEKPVAESYVMNYPNLESMVIYIVRDKSVLGAAVAIKKDNHDFLEKINDIIAQLKATKQIEEFVEKSKILTADVVR